MEAQVAVGQFEIVDGESPQGGLRNWLSSYPK